MSTLPSEVLQLPPEIWGYICSNLPRQDLRNLRLVCRYLQSSPTTFLFESIYLHVSLDSFHKLQMISEHPAFSRYVRRVYYDGRIVAPFLFSCEQGNWIDNYLDVRMRMKFSELDWKEKDKVYSTLKSHMKGQEYIRTDGHEREMLQHFLAGFPCLCGVYVESLDLPLDRSYRFTKDFCPSNTVLRTTFTAPDFYGQQNDHYFWNLLEATVLTKPDVSEVSGLKLNLWAWSRRGDPLLLFKRLSNLRRLTLEFTSVPHRSSLGDILIQLSSLEHLGLAFQEMAPGNHSFDTRMLYLSGEKIHWRRLRTLSLHAVPTTSKHFEAFLRKHSDSLRSLELENMTFSPGPESPHNQFISWIDFIQFLHEELTLNDVKFNGSLYNCGNEKWSISDNPDTSYGSDCLKYKIERYITHKGTCPFTPTEIKNNYSIPSNEHDVERLWLFWRWSQDGSWILEKARDPEYNI